MINIHTADEKFLQHRSQPETNGFRHFLLLLALCSIVACSGPATDPESHEAATTSPEVSSTAVEDNVRPDVNNSYKNPDLNVSMWAERFTGESREVFAQRFNVLEALDLKAGQRIADIGAGTGLYVKLFAEAVGTSGAVYAVDISQPFLEFIKRKAEEDQLAHVETVLGVDKSSNLPDASVDVVFHSDTYHHFEYPKTMTRDLARALTADGELFVLDFERIEGATPPAMLNHVRAGKEVVIAEIEASGFDLVEEIDLPGLQENYLLKFKKR